MDIQALLIKVINSQNPQEIFSRSNYKKEYVDYLKLLHPDVCHLPLAEEAVTKLNLYKKEMEELFKIEDDAGVFQQVNGHTLICKGEMPLLEKSLENYRQLMKLNDMASAHFKKYLPASMELKDNSLLIYTNESIVPLTHLTLPQEHVSWLVSRMFEFISWLHQVGFCHAGINPESISVVPETHGIICMSFYHMNKLNAKLETISGKYFNWYPPIIFDEKRAIPYIDINLVQRTALYVLGDKSGNGIKLKNTHNEHLINFLISPHYNAFSTFDEYRNLLKTIFGKPTFHKLNI